MEVNVNRTKFSISEGLTNFKDIDALLHPTNDYLWFAGAFECFKEIGGQQLEKDAMAAGPIKIGKAVATSGGRLNARHVIHMAAWGQDLLPKKSNIYKALIAGLDLAVSLQCRSLALPVMGSHIPSFSLAEAIDVTIMTLMEYCLRSTAFSRVVFLPSNYKEKMYLQRVITSINTLDLFGE